MIPATKRHIGIRGMVIAMLAASCGLSSTAIAETPAAQKTPAEPEDNVITTASGLRYKVFAPGEGPKPGDTDYVMINYKGMLADGKVFDQAEQVPMPVSGVVAGFAEGLKLMSRGAKYRLWIPPALGYGAEAKGDAIPANSTLVFDLELLDFRTIEEIMQMQQAPDAPANPAEDPAKR